MNYSTIFHKNFVKSIGDKINVRSIISKLDLALEPKEFEEFINKKKIIEDEKISVVHKGPSYYLLDYSEIIKHENRDVRSIASTHKTKMTTIAEELETDLYEMVKSYKENKKSSDEIVELKEALNVLTQENKALTEKCNRYSVKISKLKNKNYMYEREYKNDIKNPECFFDVLKKTYPEIEDIEIKVRIPSKKNKVKRKIINGYIK